MKTELKTEENSINESVIMMKNMETTWYIRISLVKIFRHTLRLTVYSIVEIQNS